MTMTLPAGNAIQTTKGMNLQEKCKKNQTTGCTHLSTPCSRYGDVLLVQADLCPVQMSGPPASSLVPQTCSASNASPPPEGPLCSPTLSTTGQNPPFLSVRQPAPSLLQSPWDSRPVLEAGVSGAQFRDQIKGYGDFAPFSHFLSSCTRPRT